MRRALFGVDEGNEAFCQARADNRVTAGQVGLANLTAESGVSQCEVLGFDDSAGRLTIGGFEAGIAVGVIVETVVDPAAAC